MRWFDVGVEAKGVIAIGQFATGVVAIGQSALGVVAIGQMARGVFALGQLAVGIVSIGQVSIGVWWTAGMLGMATRSPGFLVMRMLPNPGPEHEMVPAPALSTRRWVLAAVGLVLLALAWWVLVGQSLSADVFADGGVLRPERSLR